MLEFFAEICHKPEMANGRFRDLANRWFQPLTHVSARSFPRVSATYVNRGTRDTRHSKRFAVAHQVAHSVRRPFRAAVPGKREGFAR
jgi:hypothetical protein